MTRMTGMDSLAEASAALVQDYDLTDVLAQTVADAVASVGASAAGLLVTGRGGDLDLLVATSHEAAELETYQGAVGEGPCVECVRHQRALHLTLGQVVERWPELGRLMDEARFGHVMATPLRWRGSTLGGLNLFWSDDQPDTEAAGALAQAFSDMLTLFIVHSDPVSPEQAHQMVLAALEGRTLIEQAKGVLAEQEGLDMAAAYRRLLELATGSGDSLTATAAMLVERAGSSPH